MTLLCFSERQETDTCRIFLCFHLESHVLKNFPFFNSGWQDSGGSTGTVVTSLEESVWGVLQTRMQVLQHTAQTKPMGSYLNFFGLSAGPEVTKGDIMVFLGHKNHRGQAGKECPGVPFFNIL